MKDIVKVDPLTTIVIAGHKTLSRVTMIILTVRVTDAEHFLHMLLPAMNVPGLGHHLFSEGIMTHKEVSTIIAKESYLNVGQFKIPLRKDID